MKMIINEKSNTLKEASLLCVGYVRKNNGEDTLGSILQSEDNPLAKKYIKTTFKIIDEVYRLLDAYSEVINKYYQQIQNVQLSLIDSLFLDLYQGQYSTLQEFSDYLATLSQEEVNYIIMSNLSDELVSSKTKVISNKEFIRFIRRLNCDEKVQLLLVDLAMNWQEHIDVLTPILDKIEKHIKKYAKEIKEIHAYGIENIKAKHNLLEQLQKRTSFKIDEGTNYSFEVSVVVFQPIQLSLSIINDSNLGFITVGALFNFDYLDGKQDLSKESILEIAKIFADSTKMDILKYLSKGQVYGKEIATETGLTPATISHHMHALNQCNFVSIHLKMNKTYYSIEKENIVEAIERIKSYFELL